MNQFKHLLLAASGSLLLGACQMEPVAPEPVLLTEGAPMSKEESKAPAETCDGIYETRGWEAWINRMPGPDMEPMLHVVGQVDTRTGGYEFEWQEGPLDRSAMPALRLRLTPIAPDGMATQAITTHDLMYHTQLPGQGYSRVIIGCGDTVLGEITEITDVY